MKDWEDLADWYDKKQGDVGDPWHSELIDPVLLKVIGKPEGLSVLDLGCGNGYLSRMLAKAGAKVTALDRSRRMVKNAKAHDPKNKLKITYLVSDGSKIDAVDDESMDLVFANMSLMDIEDAEGAISEVGRILEQGGRFVASIPHPCFLVESNSGWVMEKVAFEPPKIYRKVRAYREIFSDKVPWLVGEGRQYTREFHRPLNWYARILSSNGLAITALEEPAPSKKFLKKEAEKNGDIGSKGFLEVPLHLVIEARKI